MPAGARSHINAQVPQSANHYTGEPDGGMTIYYIQPPTNEKVTAFPKVCMLPPNPVAHM